MEILRAGKWDETYQCLFPLLNIKHKTQADQDKQSQFELIAPT